VPTAEFHVVAYDFGVKRNILRMLVDRGCRLTVVPAQTPAREVLARKPDGVFLSNGPGDPEPCDYAIAAIREHHRRAFRPSASASATSCSARHRRAHAQDEVRSSRGQPSGDRSRQRPRDDLQPEPRLRGRRSHSLPPNVRVTHRARCSISSNQGIALDRRTGVQSFQGHPGSQPRVRMTWPDCSTDSST
jgi:carbamoyl-phosphate synthase small subunit